MYDSKVFRAAKYVIIILIAGMVGIFLGRFMTRYETRLLFSREYCGSYRGIDVYKCGELDSNNVISHLLMLEKAPQILADACSALYFTGGSLNVPEMSGAGARALGLTQDDIVFITADSFYADVLYHELFHAYDNSSGKLSDAEDFRDIYSRERSFVKVECLVEESDRAEFFAAAGAEYLLNPGSLKAAAPDTYGYFDGLFGGEVHFG